MAPMTQNIRYTESTFSVKQSVTDTASILVISILACIGVIFCAVFVAFTVRAWNNRGYIPKRKKMPYKSVYLDEITGTGQTAGTFNSSLYYSLQYNLDYETLIVGVIEATSLPKRPDGTMPDSYVSVKLMEETKSGVVVKATYRKTLIEKNTTNPIWNISFRYAVLESELRNIAVVFELFDYDNLGQDRSMGQLCVALKDIDFTCLTGRLLENSGGLSSGHSTVDGIGELCIGLGYYPQFQRLDVIIYEARKLTLQDELSSKSEAQLCVTVELKSKKHSMGIQKTKTRTWFINPYFNEKMRFYLQELDLNDCQIVCKLKNRGKLGLKKTMGCIWIGNSAPLTTGVKHWNEVMTNPSRAYVRWHVLLGNPENVS